MAWKQVKNFPMQESRPNVIGNALPVKNGVELAEKLRYHVCKPVTARHSFSMA